MKRSELIRFKGLVQEEIARRERRNELLENELVKEYLELSNIEPSSLDTNNIKEIIKQILKDFKITETNGIYVCTGAWYSLTDNSYETASYLIQNVDINSPYAECKTYSNIELGDYIFASQYGSINSKMPIIKEFECRNIVLNPFNTSENKNGFEQVQMEFFEKTLKYGQEKSKRRLLEKYHRL